MNPHKPKATVYQIRNFRFRASLSGPVARMCLLMACLCGGAHALYTQETITAYRVPDGKINVDGTPELLWRSISAQPSAVSTITFQDYRRMVLLQPEQVRNADPSLYVKNPVNGYISMLAAYDNTALYFLFLVKTKTVANSGSLCTTTDNLWKADAPEVYLDPTVWKDDTTSYRSFFTADAGGLIFGTSPKTIQLDKPINDKDTRLYFRNRVSADRFQVVTSAGADIPAGTKAVSRRHSATDTATVVVEMKIPYWGGLSASYAPTKSMFISWGFNMYPDSLWSNCDGNPIAYRWAKHYLNYDNAPDKPPGWRAKDSTHYDPSRSWDGWGRMTLSASGNVDTLNCRYETPVVWDMQTWKSACTAATATAGKPGTSGSAFRLGRGAWSGNAGTRDLRGRSVGSGSTLLIFPWHTMPGDGADGIDPERSVPF
ncbi:MAG: hypothetical protein JWO30_1988 [Fibrobacteres bacterium]|nr:hypothetical protein [Fibrobacterota bacterium]